MDNRLLARHKRLISLTSVEKVRSIMNDIEWDDRLISIRGARGVGKTTLMLQYIKLHFGSKADEAIYISLDDPYFTQHSLLDFVEEYHQSGGKRVFMDEVHKYPTWSTELKNAYDSYPDMQFVYSGSSLLNILNAQADLSRRSVNYNMQGLSFREYLSFYHSINLPAFRLEDIFTDADSVCDIVLKACKPLKYFDDYLQYGYYPFYLEGSKSYYLKIENVVDMILEIELPQLCGVEVANIRKLKSLLTILSSNVPYSLDITKLSAAAGMSRNTILSYLNYMSRAGLLRLLYSDNVNIKKMQKPDKVYMDNPNLLYAISTTTVNIGTAREVFFTNQLGYRNNIEYSKTQADYTINGQYTIEVGGASKEGKQLKGSQDGYIAADNIEYALGNKIPLWIFGFLY